MSDKRILLILAAVLVTIVLVTGSVEAAKGGKPSKPPPSPEPPADPEIVFTFEGKKKDPTATFVMNADGSNNTKLIEECRYPQWSPEGSQIACGGPGDNHWLSLVNLDGEIDDYIEAWVGGGAMAWSPDGMHIVYRPNTLPSLYAVKLGGGAGDPFYFEGEPYELVAPAIEGYYYGPTWSYDGTRIAATFKPQEGEDQRRRIVLLTLDTDAGGNLVVIDEDEVLVDSDVYTFGDLDWARTKDTLAFAANTEDGRFVYTFDLDDPSAVPQQLGWSRASPSWSPDDSQLVMEDFYGNGIWLYTFATGVESEIGIGNDTDWKR